MAIVVDKALAAEEAVAELPPHVQYGAKAAQGTYVACAMCKAWKKSEQEIKQQELRRILARHLESRNIAVGITSNYRRTRGMLSAREPKYTQLATAWQIITDYQEKRRTKMLGCRLNLRPCVTYNEDARTTACEILKRWLEAQCNNSDVSATELEGYRNVCRGLADLDGVFKPGNRQSFCNTMAKVSEFLENALQQRLNTTRACLEILLEIKKNSYHFVLDAIVFLLAASTNLATPGRIYTSSMVMLRSTTAPQPKVWLAERGAQEAAEKMRSAWQTDCGRLLHLCLVSQPCLQLSSMMENGGVDIGIGRAGSLPVRVRASARCLPKIDMVGWVDPYLKLRAGIGTGKDFSELSRCDTEKLSNQRNPDWKPVELQLPAVLPAYLNSPPRGDQGAAEASEDVFAAEASISIKVTNKNISKDKTFAEAGPLSFAEVLERAFVREGSGSGIRNQGDFLAALEHHGMSAAEANEVWVAFAGPGASQMSWDDFLQAWPLLESKMNLTRLGTTAEQAWTRARAPVRLSLREREGWRPGSKGPQLTGACVLLDFSVPSVAEQLEATRRKWLHDRNFDDSGLEVTDVADKYLEAVQKLDDAVHFFTILLTDFVQLAATGGDLAMILVMDVLHALLDELQECTKRVVDCIDKIHGAFIKVKASGQKGKHFTSNGAMDEQVAAVKRIREGLLSSFGELKRNSNRTLFRAKLQQGETCLRSIQQRLITSSETRRRTDRFARYTQGEECESGMLFRLRTGDALINSRPLETMLGRAAGA